MITFIFPNLDCRLRAVQAADCRGTKAKFCHLQSEKKYRHLFFDLDHALWDFEANARATLLETLRVPVPACPRSRSFRNVLPELPRA